MDFSKKASNLTRKSVPTTTEISNDVCWPVLYVFCQHYPDEPSSETIKQCYNFIKSLPYMVPCCDFGYYLNTFTIKYLKNNPDIAHSKHKLLRFFIEAYHNFKEN